MLRSLMTAVTGIRAHQTMLDVVGNNVANVNTTGFKRSTTVFQDLLYQTSRGATSPGDNRGGINPVQVGLGVQVAGIEMVYTAGPLQYTGNRTDMAISGDGFFVFSDGMSNVYSRAGNFSLDGKSVLTHVGTGYRVQGYPMEQDPSNPMNYIRGATLSDIRLSIGAKMEANPTSVVGFRCNLNSRVGTYLPMGMPDIDAQINLDGNAYSLVSKTGITPATFLTYTLDTVPAGAATSSDFVFALTDVKDGKPVLSIVDPTGGGMQINNEDVELFYNPTTGAAQLKYITGPSTGAAIWETNVLSSATYTSFELKDVVTPATYRVIAEFSPSGDSPVPVTFWISGGTPLIQTRAQVMVPLKPDGTFDIPDAGLDITGPDFPAPWDAPTGTPPGPSIVLNFAAQGRGFNIDAINDGTLLTPKLSTVGMVQQAMTSVHTTKLDIYDCQGNAHTLEVQYKKIAENEWRWEAFFPKEPELFAYKPSGVLKFGPCGKLESPDSVDLDLPFSLVGSNNQKVTLDFSGKSFGLDVMEGITQYGSPTTTKAYFQDGYAMGTMNDFSTGKDGTISGIYSNGKVIPLYRIAMATFQNSNGLERVGDTCFRESANSGLPQIGVPGEDGAGLINGGNLEMSNVDLSEEFTRLILAQRGFQANARVVTTSDGILEEVVNLKR